MAIGRRGAFTSAHCIFGASAVRKPPLLEPCGAYRQLGGASPGVDSGHCAPKRGGVLASGLGNSEIPDARCPISRFPNSFGLPAGGGLAFDSAQGLEPVETTVSSRVRRISTQFDHICDDLELTAKSPRRRSRNRTDKAALDHGYHGGTRMEWDLIRD